jgi:ankyrin repeat protein
MSNSNDVVFCSQGFVRKLAGAGADLNAARDRADPALDGKVVGPAGPTPLQAARAKGNAECVAVLLELGASETGSYS